MCVRVLRNANLWFSLHYFAQMCIVQAVMHFALHKKIALEGKGYPSII